MATVDPVRYPCGVKSSYSIARLLLDWQDGAEDRCLHTLLDTTRPLIESTARTVLHRVRVFDHDAVDETCARVFDTIWRLSTRSALHGTVKRFDPALSSRAAGSDPAVRYIRWLTRKRTMDVLRARRRHNRREKPMSVFDLDALCDAKLTADAMVTGVLHEGPTPEEWLMAAIAVLDQRSQDVLKFLFDGQSQSWVAQRVGVCAGTVSRIRSKAVARLRLLLAEQP